MWQYQNTDELYHHGILGMKWGIRRYQNADGTLTPAGRKRANKLASQYAKVTGKKLIVKKKAVIGNQQKSIHEMSNAELQEKINRINLENTYARLTTPKETKTRGQRFIDKVKRDVIAPAAVDAGRAVVTKAFKNIGFSLIEGNKKSSKSKKKVINNYKNDMYKEFTKSTKKEGDVIKNQFGTITVNKSIPNEYSNIKRSVKKSTNVFGYRTKNKHKFDKR